MDVVVVELGSRESPLLLVIVRLLEVSEMERFATRAVSREPWPVES